MQDPNQDRLMLRTMSYFRLKFRRLPRAYRDFLTASLAPGATLYVCRCTRSWPVTRTSARSVFQFGAVGGASTDEYFHGGPRVRAHFARYGVARQAWDPPRPDAVAPEAEWGFEPALSADLAALAAGQGWRVVEIAFEEPEALSRLALQIYRGWYQEAGIAPRRLLVESFVLMDPWRALRLRALPLWLVFPVQPSRDLLAQVLDSDPVPDEIDLMLFSHGTDSIGLAGVDAWKPLLARARRQGRFLGVDQKRFPRDFATFTRFHKAVAALKPVHAPPPALPAVRLEQMIRRHGAPFGVTLEPGSGAVELTGATAPNVQVLRPRPAEARRG